MAKPAKSAAEKASASEMRAKNREKALALAEGVQLAKAEHDGRVALLAEQHGKSEQYVKKLMNHTVMYSKNRQKNLWNAKQLHVKQEVNDGEHSYLSCISQHLLSLVCHQCFLRVPLAIVPPFSMG